jgi:hypothetical protein
VIHRFPVIHSFVTHFALKVRLRVTEFGWRACSNLTAELALMCTDAGKVAKPDISNNVGPVKSFLSALLRSLRRVIFVVLFNFCTLTTTARS